jgi:citrate (Si)-synthase
VQTGLNLFSSDLVGSALSDPYLSYSAALFGLAGPLHGSVQSIAGISISNLLSSLANQEALRWILAMQKAVGTEPSSERVKDYLWETLNSGRVVPGYGHGVLRSPDPRFIALQEFCDARPELNSSPIIKIVKMVSEVAPGVLTEHGKTKNPYPNVDATSGCLLYHYGLTEFKVCYNPTALMYISSYFYFSLVLYCDLWCFPRYGHQIFKIKGVLTYLGYSHRMLDATSMGPRCA